MFSGLPVAQTKRWTTLFSFTLQAALVSGALIFPVLYPHSLPDAFAHGRIFVPVREGDVHIQTSHAGPSTGDVHLNPIVVNHSTFSFRRNTSDAAFTDTVPVPSFTNVIGSKDGIPEGLTSDVGRPMPHPVATVTPPPVSRMMEGNLIHRVDPQYPVIARQAGVQGTVVIKAIISRDGAIEREELLSGSPLLGNAALDAVRRWKYRPYYLNGEPVEVETQITVNFVLNR